MAPALGHDGAEEGFMLLREGTCLLPLLLIALVLTGCDDAASRDDDGTTTFGNRGPPGTTPPAYVEAPVCDVPSCDEQLFFLRTEAPPGSPVPMRRVTAAEAAADVRAAFAEGRPGAQLLAALAGRVAGRPVTGDARWRAHAAQVELAPASAAWLVQALDTVAPGWEAIAPAGDGSEPPLASHTRALETVGCGAMRLQLTLDSVEVVKRDDDFAGDRIYCVMRAEDDAVLELTETEISPNLHPGDRHWFEDPVFYGRDAPRDPGRQLRITYDCFEHDSPEDYENIRRAIDIARSAGKALGAGVIIALAEAAAILTRLAAAFDGDDHLVTHEEVFGRQALWALMLEPPRTLGAEGRNKWSDWAWRLQVTADGCATGEPAPTESNTFRREETPAPRCDASTCDGCCVGTRCVAGDDEQACGAGGGACRSCDTGESCQRGACHFDTGRPFEVVAVRAEIEDRCWDAGCGPPDLLLEVATGGLRGGTTHRQDTLYPQWNETVIPSVAGTHLLDQIALTLTDLDLTFDDLAARCTVRATVAELRAGRGIYRCGPAAVHLGFRAR